MLSVFSASMELVAVLFLEILVVASSNGTARQDFLGLELA